MINKVILMGRLTADPELKQTPSNVSSCRFTVAVNRPYKKGEEQQADFIRCVAWRQTAEFVSRYFSKGKLIVLEGSLRNNDYTDRNGVKHYGMDVNVDNVSFAGSKADNGTQAASQAAQQPSRAEDKSFDDISLDGFEEILNS